MKSISRSYLSCVQGKWRLVPQIDLYSYFLVIWITEERMDVFADRQDKLTHKMTQVLPGDTKRPVVAFEAQRAGKEKFRLEKIDWCGYTVTERTEKGLLFCMANRTSTAVPLIVSSLEWVNDGMRLFLQWITHTKNAMIPYFGKSLFYSSFSWWHDIWTAHKWSGKTFCAFNCRFSRKSSCNFIQLIAIRPSAFTATSEDIYSCTQNFRQFITSVERLSPALRKYK